MQGVEILTSTQVVTEYAVNWTACCVGFIVVFGIGLILGIKTAIDEDDWFCMVPICGTFIILGLLGGSVANELFKCPVNYTTQYQVTISDEVSMTEFYENYKVIDQDGKIFTVRDKTKEEN